MSALTYFAPAKLNLFLAITGRRADGYHDLVSLVAPLQFGDMLAVAPADRFSLACAHPDVPADESNLVLKAARAFAAATGWTGGAAFVLEKRIPAGAGLGGGSSDAAAALQALNERVEPGRRLSPAGLLHVAAQVGSDCPLFLQAGPVIMRGRGELITPLPPNAAARLRGRRVLVFKPAFAIATPWAYAQLAAKAPASYVEPRHAEARIAAWLEDPAASVESLLSNTLEAPAFAKFLALPVLLQQLEQRFGLRPRMSGSGSACFALLPDDTDAVPIAAAIRAAWGESAFVLDTRLA